MNEPQEEAARAALLAADAAVRAIEETLRAIHDSLPVLPEEVRPEDLEADPPPAVEMRASIQTVLGDLGSVRRTLLDAVEYRPGDRQLRADLLSLRSRWVPAAGRGRAVS